VTRRAVLGPEAALAVLGQCTALQELTLAGCELRHVPHWLARLQCMTALQLRGNYLQDLPAGMPCMGLPPALQQLNLADNRLRELPCSITQLTSLTRLVLDSNYLTTLSASFWELPAIWEVSARENMLSCLPECSPRAAAGHRRGRSCSCSAECTAMVCCSSGSCRRAVGAPAPLAATAAPSFAPAQPVQASAVARAQPAQSFAGLGPLSAEEEDLLGAIGFLQVSTSRQGSMQAAGELLPHAAACAAGAAAVEVLPGSAHQRARRCACAGSLRSLVLADNQLTELPSGISQLSSLRMLDLSKNQLRSLPDKAGIWALTGLTSLQLADNHLHKLPGGLALLQGLVELDVSGNHLPVSVVPVCRSADAAAAVATPPSAAGVAAGAPAQACTAPPVISAPGASSSRALHGPIQKCAAAASPAPVAAARPAGTSNSLALVTVLLQEPMCAPSSAVCSNSITAVRKPPAALPCPLGRLPSLQQVRLGRQQSEGSSKCPLQLLLDGLFDLAERIRCLGPIKRQCPVAKAAAAAVAHITGVTSSRRAKALRRQEELLRRMQSEQQWAAGAGSGPKLPAQGP
jgi:Leucine-rich repeat (LRR) protein